MLKALRKGRPLIDEHEEYEMKQLNFAVGDDNIEYKPVESQVDEDIDGDEHYTHCRILDNIITNINGASSLLFHPRKSVKYCTNIFVFLLFCLTLFCNVLLIYFIYDYCMDPNHDPTILLYITGISCCYLSLCGLFQAFNYPQHTTSLNELQGLLDELIASYPKIKMLITSCNLFIKNENEKGSNFAKIFIHSIENIYEYHDCRDVSDDFNQMLNSLINDNDNKCYCWPWNIIEFNIHFQIKCGNQQTVQNYLDSRYKFITENVKTRSQKYISSAIYCDDDGQPLNNKYIGAAPIEIGKDIQFWIINDKSWISKLFIEDATYWIFCVLLLSQWLYVVIMFALVSKRQKFNVSKEIFYNDPSPPKYNSNR